MSTVCANLIEKQRYILAERIYLLADLIDLYGGGTDEQWYRLDLAYDQLEKLGVKFLRKSRY